MYGPPSDVQNLSLRKIMAFQTSHEYFPIRIDQFGASIDYVDCGEGKIKGDGFEVHTCRLNHPVTCLAYKVIHDGKTFVYGGDHEPFHNVYRDLDDAERLDEHQLAEKDREAAAKNGKIAEFCRNADLVSWDAQYSGEEYQSKKGWGHSWYEYNLEFAGGAGIKHIVFTHHDPAKDDGRLGELEKHYAGMAAAKGFKLDFAREGMTVEI
jgi:ribonuclease BN (tRNA processing enzyme)